MDESKIFTLKRFWRITTVLHVSAFSQVALRRFLTGPLPPRRLPHVPLNFRSLRLPVAPKPNRKRAIRSHAFSCHQARIRRETLPIEEGDVGDGLNIALYLIGQNRVGAESEFWFPFAAVEVEL